MKIFRDKLRSIAGALILFGGLLLPAHAQLGLPPSITVQPVDQVVLGGDTVRFTVVASSLTTLSYQWYFRAAPISGATASILTLTGVDTNDTGGYYVDVRNLVGRMDSRTALLTVLASNDVPIAGNDAYTLTEDTILSIPAPGILTNDTDVYPGGVSAALVSNPANGVLTFSTNGGFIYRPDTNFFGTDSFTYRAQDGITSILEQNNSGGNKMEIKNGQPGAQSFRHGIAGDPSYTIKKVVLRLTKKAGQANNLNFSIGTAVNSGTLAGSAFTIPMSGISNTTEGVSFQNYDVVYATDVGPFTAGTTYYLNLDNAPSGRDVWVEYAGSSTYSKGTYYKTGSDDGKDMRFEIRESDHSESATVTLNVTPVNDAPIPVNDTATTLEDVSVFMNVLANDSDPDGTPLTLLSTATTNGTAVVSGSEVLFTPAPNFNGLVVLSYVVSDGALLATGLVTVTVVPVNDAPFANNDTTNTLEDVSVTIQVLANDTDVERTALTVTSATAADGTVVISGTNLVFTPATNFNGLTSLSYVVTDGQLFATGMVSVTVIPVNDRPVAVNDLAGTMEDVSVRIPVLANDVDVDSASLTLVSTATTNGTAIVSGSDIIFQAASNFFGTVWFSYTVSDGALTATGWVTVVVTSVNDAPPEATNDVYTTAEDMPLTVAAPGLLTNDWDVDGDAKSAILVGNVTSGILTLNADGSFFYRPNTNFNGSDSFTYRASDGFATGNLATVTINVTAVNDAPRATNDTASTPEDTAVTIPVLANDYDVEGTALTITGTSWTNGVVTTSGTNLVFRPATNFNGTAVFSYTASDGTNSATATVTVTVTPVYDPPIPISDSTNTLEDTSVTVSVLANDYNPDPRPLTLTSVATTNGTAVMSGTNVVFTPATNFNGSTFFSYVFSDGIGSFTGGVTVAVSAVNDVPRSTNDTYTTLEDTRLTIPAPGLLTNDFDVEGTPLSALLVGNVSNGTLSLSANGSFIYTPSTNFNGTDSFTYRASDGLLNGNLATVTITVTPVYDAPIPVSDSTNLVEDNSVTMNVLANDYNPDPRPLTLTRVATTNGTAVMSGTNVVFTPATNFNGTTFFSYVFSDGIGSFTGGVTVAVSAVNDVPRSTNDTYITLEDTRLTIPAPGLLTNDFDVEGTPLSALLVGNVSNGTLSLSANGSFIYTPSTNFNGTDSFTYQASDGVLTGNLATVTITVTPVNDSPITVDDTAAVLEDESVSVSVLLNDSDIENDALTITSTATTNGTAVVSGTNVVFTPATNFYGTVFFTYTLSDGALSATGGVTVTVTAVNDVPVANPDGTNTLEDTSVTIRVLGNDTDVEGSVLSLVGTFTTNGTAVINGTNVVFTPSLNFHGTLVFWYGMWDGTLLATGVVTVAVAPVNDAPLAVSDTFTTSEDVVLSRPAPGILANDLDVDGDTITALLVSDVTNGLLALNPDGSFSYTPALDYSGSDSFTYQVTDGLVLGNVVTVTLNISPVVDLLRFVSQERVTNGTRLALSGPTASPYVIQASSNLTEWMPISTNFAPMGQVVFTDTRDTNDQHCFYRALISPATNMQQNVSGGGKVSVRAGFEGAQSFRHGTLGGSDYGISKIVIRISKGSPVPTDNLVFSIGTGVNAGAVARSTFFITPQSVTDNSDGATFQNYEIVYPEPVGPFTAGITYYLNFLPLATNNKEYWLERSWGVSTYAPGTFYSGGGDIGRDMRFEIWGQ